MPFAPLVRALPLFMSACLLLACGGGDDRAECHHPVSSGTETEAATACAADAYLEADACGGPGVCTARPTACTREFRPVCGCDGRTYPTACVAHSEGVTVRSEGACGSEREPAPSCGSRGQSPCPEGTACIHPLGADCGRADAPGRCIAPPPLGAEVHAPVCGCDGRTYDNDCLATRAGVGVDRAGACP